MKKITVVGAGLVGSLEALFLAKRGYQVEVFERRPDMRRSQLDGGRSINLVVSDRGWRALRLAGVEEEIKKITVPVYGRMTHSEQGETSYYPYSIKKKAIFSVSRAELNARLMDLAEEHGNIRFHFDQKCLDVDLPNATCVFEDADGSENTVQSDLVIGTDGAFSAVRQSMTSLPGFQHTETFIEHGYKELVIPPGADGKPQLDPSALHIWPRKAYMLMALANLDGGFTCTLFFPLEGEKSFNAINTEQDLMDFFRSDFPDAIPLMPTLTEDYFDNPTSKLVIVKCNPWNHGGTAALMGDAAHAIVPFYGEGMNCGFEDCYTLEKLLDEHGDNDMNKVLDLYSNARKANGDAIADLSLRNFVEMRDLVADPEFILRKKIEGNLYKQYPDKWIPLYSQVKFSDLPYADAWREGQKQDRVMQKVLALPDIEQNWNSEEIVERALSYLEDENA